MYIGSYVMEEYPNHMQQGASEASPPACNLLISSLAFCFGREKFHQLLQWQASFNADDIILVPSY